MIIVKILMFLFLSTVYLFTSTAIAADKVVVIPLNSCAGGLTNCFGKCVDIMNNPSFCGECTTDCGGGNYCNKGLCKREIGSPCTEDSACISGVCSNNLCWDKRIVFVSSETYTGALGGLAGADSKCQALADAAGLDGTYKAWLSIGIKPTNSTFSLHDFDYSLVNGTVVANGWRDLTDGTLDHRINVDENGNEILTKVWTNTKADGTYTVNTTINTCNFFTQDDIPGSYAFGGDPSQKDNGGWSDGGGGKSCYQENALYCFEQ